MTLAPRAAARRHRAESPYRRELPALPAGLRRVLVGGLGGLATLLALVCLVATVGAIALGGRVLVVQTGSMTPAMPVGTILVARPVAAGSVHPGQVIGVQHPDGKLVTHRLVSTKAAGGGQYQLVLKGDANRAADTPVVTASVMEPLVVVPVSVAQGPMHLVRWPWFQYWLGVLTVTGAWLLARRSPTGSRTGSPRRG